MENVINVDIKDKEAEDIYGYEVEPKAGVDLREYLSLTVMKNIGDSGNSANKASVWKRHLGN